MRRFAFVIAFLSSLPVAHAGPDLTSGWNVGADAGVLLREEAGGNRSVLPTIAPRVSWRAWSFLDVTAQYAFAYSPAPNLVATASTQFHRLALRADGRLSVGPAVLWAGAGPALSLSATTLIDRGEAMQSVVLVRPALATAAGLDVPLGALTLRASAEAFVSSGRTDVAVLLGAAYSLGGAR